MIITRLICDGCGTDSGLTPQRDGRLDLDYLPKHWLVDQSYHPSRHYCPTCRRAVEAADLRTALVAPRKA